MDDDFLEIMSFFMCRDRCSRCGSKDVKPEDFRDELSRMRFEVTGLCQKCQDEEES